ncbi:hypothetical protein [Photobacterium halotolerans]|uniref:Uncharacterized protein n=1 Tax=Photobacterium halotolerans TaxID=265726 RepID=A0A7X4W932_9GAMM|nr:hypothetical protein [Photobacterium halotolerans]NAW64391.1 hypothetical protein [Photobacterium halotolerans]
MVEVHINKCCGGRLTTEALLRPTGSVDVNLKVNAFPKEKVCIFHVAGENFWFNLGFIDGELTLQRCDYDLRVSEEFFKQLPEDTSFIASWTPGSLIILLGKRGFDGPSIRKVMEIEPRPVPASLLRWARHQSLIPTEVYSSEAEFVARVHTGLAMLQDKIDIMSNRDIFWNVIRDTNKIKRRSPKKEADLHGVIHALLSDQFFLASIEVVPEAMSSAGRLDFLFVGQVTGLGMAKICAEFKLAHSKDLYRGIEFQLPAYMSSHRTENGAYCIIDFRSKEFALPKEDSLAMHNRLAIASRRGWSNIDHPIKIHKLKVAKPEAASKLKNA